MAIPDYIKRSAEDEMFQAEVIRLMRTKHFGVGNAATLPIIMTELFGSSESSNNNRVLRKTIETINQEREGLIVSDVDHGYWWASGLHDGLEAVDKNKKRGMTIINNANHLEGNILAAYGGQVAMF